jgi:agmatine deiminase
MPAEWERHEATWLAWPHHPTDWPGKLDTIRWVYGEMIRKISAGERVRLLVGSTAEQQLASRYLKQARVNLKQIDFIMHPTNRGWTRDTGPVFVSRSRGIEAHTVCKAARPRKEQGLVTSAATIQADGASRRAIRRVQTETAIVHFHFNGWAKYDDWSKDRKVPETAARLLGKKLFHAKVRGKDFVMEGGGIDVNGRGTLLTTEECYLDPNVQVRNPGLSREDIEEALKNYLAVTNVLWLANGPIGDDTHGHIDDICRFVGPRTLVLIREENKKDPNYRPLAENWERVKDLRLEDGSRPEVVALPMPEPLFFNRWRLPASYANFHISNAAVLVPTFNDRNDRIALGILSELITDRPVIGIHAVDLVLGFGTIHCLTQQQPE